MKTMRQTPAPFSAFRPVLLGLVLCFGLTWAPSAGAQGFRSVPEAVTGVAKDELMQSLASKQDAHRALTLPCRGAHMEGIACGAAKAREIADTDCRDGEHLIDLYSFEGTAGQRVRVELTSSAFDTYVELYNPSEILQAQNDNSAFGTNSLVLFTLDVTGTWYILVTHTQTGEAGPYTLTLQCSAVGNCIPNDTTLCLKNGRFAVTATFVTAQGQSGNGQAVPGTSDAGLFWFFTANNIEAVVKVVDGCSFNGRYWFFAGGLTNIQVILTVTDTATGAMRTYTNPQGMPFVPIQDTAAFATCP